MIVGILLSIVVIITTLYFKPKIEAVAKKIENKVSSIRPESRGFVVEPMTEAEEAREEIIERNRAQGKDTKISELV